MKTELSQALIKHRQGCPDCTETRACLTYVNIVRSFTAPRVLRHEVSSAPHTILSVRETQARVAGEL